MKVPLLRRLAELEVELEVSSSLCASGEDDDEDSELLNWVRTRVP